MRKFCFLLPIALIGLLSTPTELSAGGCKYCVNSIPKTHPRARKTKVCTKVLRRCKRTLTATGLCGKTYQYTVNEITYQDIYSDGTTRIWKSTI